MRVAIVSPEFPPTLGGIETYAWEFTRELARRGHEITVFTTRHSQGEAAIPGVSVLPVLRLRRHLDSPTLRAHRAEVWHAMNAAYSWLALEGRKTVVLLHGNDFLRPYLPVASSDLRRWPIVGWRLAEHEPGWLKLIWTTRSASLVRQALPAAHHLIANSRYTERTLLEHYPACRGRTSVGLVGVGTQFFDVPRRPAADAFKRLITVCRLSEPRKNVGAVLHALARLKGRHDFRYTIVGDGHDRARLERLAGDLGLHERVRFVGFVGASELTSLYAEADLMVLASSIIPGSHEGFGIVYLEAAASGVPSLAARLAGAAEAVAEGVSGMFVENPTVEAIGTALRKFFEGGVQFDASGCRSFARRFTWASVVDHALQHYE